ncbi:MAG TPA: 4-(cytidine 5'-diphospho)-2-C-methyl-D-erythritol kinase [Nocardioidaceae bacterium]|nr:4-(cytidine 5'-diphospho)-2-C-methyl-D-erythritol kinase [Nocardioidaceae bacterium]
MRLRTVAVTAPAKVNLCLGVGPLRDGYHELATVYQAVGLYDRVTVNPAETETTTISVHGDARLSLDDVPTDETNIAFTAARLLADYCGLPADEAAVEIGIDKGIPVAGGLAGGSADAAATLVACDTLWEMHTPREDLLRLAGELGSDVPFALVGGTAIGSGRGEIVTPVMTRGDYWWVILESPVGLSTPAVYAEFDRVHAGRKVPSPGVPDALLSALRANDVEGLAAALSNDLHAPACRLRPELEQLLQDGRDESAYASILSGSGPSCLFLCEGRVHAMQVAGALGGYGAGHVSFASGPVPGARITGLEH